MFGKKAEIVFGAGSLGRSLDQLKIDFDIQKDNTQESNKGNIKVYNISKDTAKNIESASVVILKAGYADEGELPVLSQADTYDIKTYNEGVNRVTEISIGEGINALQKDISISLDGAVSIKDIIKSVIDKLGLPESVSDKLQGVVDKKYPNGYNTKEKAKNIIKTVQESLGINITVQNNEISLYTGVNEGLAYRLTPNTGLIRSPERIIKKENGGKRYGWRCKCLLVPQINPDNIVQIKSNEIDDVQYRVINVQHKGTNIAGDWETEIEVYER